MSLVVDKHLCCTLLILHLSTPQLTLSLALRICITDDERDHKSRLRIPPDTPSFKVVRR